VGLHALPRVSLNGLFQGGALSRCSRRALFRCCELLKPTIAFVGN
jgi:hypothetical protein